MTKRHFTSDQHIEHVLVSVLRMIPDAPLDEKGRPDLVAIGPERVNWALAEHSRVSAAAWDRVVGKDDLVYVVGDIAMNPRKGAFEWFQARPGRKVLICGNHDETAGFHSKGLQERLKPDWANTFEGGISDFAFLKFGKKRAAVSHYPYDGEGERDGEDRMPEVRLRDVGIPLIHGHEHSKHKAHTSALGTPQFHVGVDAWNFEPVPEETIVEWLEWVA